MNQKTLLTVSLLLVSSAGLLRAEDDISIAGDSSTAPIYVLDGTGTTAFNINETVHGSIVVNGNFTFSMSSVATGDVTTNGTFAITGDDGGGLWEADFNGSTIYKIKKFGDFVVVNFNHTLNSVPGNQTIFGDAYTSATISSRGYMVLTGSWELMGFMSGVVNGFQDGRSTLRHSYRKTPFEQTFADVESVVGGEWVADIDWVVAGKKLSGTGTLEVGADPDALVDFDIADPVDTVDLAIKGSVKGPIFSWTAAGSGSDKKVSVKITNNDTDIVEGKNAIKAAAQSRNF